MEKEKVPGPFCYYVIEKKKVLLYIVYDVYIHSTYTDNLESGNEYRSVSKLSDDARFFGARRCY